jgi:hypothetical protein
MSRIEEMETESPPALWKRLAVDVSTAFTAALTFAPLAAIVDTAIIRAANGSSPNMFATLLASLRRPTSLLRDKKFLAVYAVYSATYGVANTAGTLAAAAKQDPAMPRFAATTVTNLSASIQKDALLSRWTSGKAPLPAPTSSLACWGARDGLTVFASFILVEPATQLAHRALPDEFVEKSPNAARNTIQFALPVAVQWLSTPVHLLGLDLYNFQNRFGAAREVPHRLALIREQYLSTAVARSMRIAAAYGVGGVANRIHEHLSAAFLAPSKKRH